MFVIWTVAILFWFNLLIAFLSDTFTRVYEQRIKANYVEMARLILDLELFYIRCEKNDEKLHLVYGQIRDEDIEDDLTIGIG